MIAAWAPFGLDVTGPPPPLDHHASREARLEFAAAGEASFEAVFEALVTGLPAVEGVERRTETIVGSDGNTITLYISRPLGATGPLPGVLHLHGGGMVILRAAGGAYVRLRDKRTPLDARAPRRARRFHHHGRRGVGRGNLSLATALRAKRD